MEDLKTLVLKWAEEKGILEHGTPLRQMTKVIEEVEELDAELFFIDDGEEGARDRAEMERGDIEVTLIILDHMMNFDRKKCLERAYQKISSRTGTMQDGVFVKDDQ